MNWEHRGADWRGPCDVYLDGKLINDVIDASPSNSMVKCVVRQKGGAVRLIETGVAFQIMHGHVRVEYRK